MALCHVNGFGEGCFDGICCEAEQSYEDVIVYDLCPSAKIWYESGLMHEIQDFGLVFFCILAVCDVEKIWMDSIQGSTIRSQVDRTKFVFGIFCANDEYDPVNDDANISFIK